MTLLQLRYQIGLLLPYTTAGLQRTQSGARSHVNMTGSRNVDSFLGVNNFKGA